jgi:hypothetical protein
VQERLRFQGPYAHHCFPQPFIHERNYGLAAYGLHKPREIAEKNESRLLRKLVIPRIWNHGALFVRMGPRAEIFEELKAVAKVIWAVGERGKVDVLSRTNGAPESASKAIKLAGIGCDIVRGDRLTGHIFPCPSSFSIHKASPSAPLLERKG